MLACRLTQRGNPCAMARVGRREGAARARNLRHCKDGGKKKPPPVLGTEGGSGVRSGRRCASALHRLIESGHRNELHVTTAETSPSVGLCQDRTGVPNYTKPH